MKLKMIALAAMLAAGSANAAIVDGSSNNGELFMTVLDSVGQQSYIMDLNVTMNDFMAATTPSSWAADANMTSFLGMVAPENKSSLVYAIGALDTNGATATDFYRFVTSASVIDLGDPLINFNLKDLGGVNVFLGDSNSYIGAGDNSAIITDTAALAYAESAKWGNNWGGAFNGTSTALIGNDVGMYLLAQSDGRFAQRFNPSVYSAIEQGGFPVYANLDMDGNLAMSVAAVPEAETYAMMLAGLGLVGFMVARRRKAA